MIIAFRLYIDMNTLLYIVKSFSSLQEIQHLSLCVETAHPAHWFCNKVNVCLSLRVHFLGEMVIWCEWIMTMMAIILDNSHCNDDGFDINFSVELCRFFLWLYKTSHFYLLFDVPYFIVLYYFIIICLSRIARYDVYLSSSPTLSIQSRFFIFHLL